MPETATRPIPITRLVYGSYAWTALLLVAAPLALLLACTPGLRRRRRLARAAARLFFRLIGSPVRAEGARIEALHPCVAVANHASYLDGMILTAALPAGFTFLIKHEMATFPVAGFVLRRLGSAFVNRDDASHRHRVAKQLVDSAVSGDALALFPEGTFGAEPGLRPFQSGAFGAAFQAGAPVVPVVISGARRKLPCDALLPSPGPLGVRLCEPLDPRRYESARDLLKAARQAMLRELDEPDLESTSPYSSARFRLPAEPT